MHIFPAMAARGIHVAIVDDDPCAGETLGALFLAAGARVSVARNPAELNALAEKDPPDVVATDRMLDVRFDGHFATVLCGSLDLTSGELRLASAGHPAPVVARAGGEVVTQPVRPGLPVGVGPDAYEEAVVHLAAGDLVVGYTDGLYERRDEVVDDGLARVREAVAQLDRHELAQIATERDAVVRSLKNEKLRTSAERLANWILKANHQQGNHQRVELTYDKRTLASRLGMTPENLSRNLALLAKHGVSSSGRAIVIDDASALESFAKPNALIDG